MSLQQLAQNIAAHGRGGDTMLAHITPEEAALLKSLGGSGTINPDTGLPEFFWKGLRSIVNTVGDAVSGVVGGVGDVVEGVVEAARDAGRDVDDFVNDEIPGGWGTVALATGAAMGGLPSFGGAETAGAVGSGSAGSLAAADAVYAGATTPLWEASLANAAGAGAGAAGAGGIAELLGSTDPLDYMNLGSGAGGDYGIGAAGAGAAGAGLGSLDPADYVGLGSGAGGDYGIGAAGAAAGLGSAAAGSSGLGGLLGAAGNFLGSPLFGSLTGGGALLGAAGLYKLIDMMKEDNKRFTTPGRQDYTGGELSKFKYSPSSFTPSRADPSKFRPGADVKTMAAGGKTDRPQLTSRAKLAALDPYQRAIAQMNNAAYGARMPTGMKAPPTNITQMGQFAAGGVSHLGDYSDGGRLLKGPGDGVSDSIPAVIGNKQPARLADGEFVVPARIVSELGNGSTDAGARKLYAMMDRIQKARGKTTGKGKVAKNTRADKYLPA